MRKWWGSFILLKHQSETDVNALNAMFIYLACGGSVLILYLLFSLFCSVEEPPHAHRDQLFHSESVLRWCAGHHHLPACQSRGGHHRDLVLWEHALQNRAIFTGRTSFLPQNTVTWSAVRPYPPFLLYYISISQSSRRNENVFRL